MSKQITRTIKSWKVIVRNTKGEILEENVTFVKPRLDKIASKKIKERGAMDFTIEIEELEQQRIISLEDFIKYSKAVEIECIKDYPNYQEV